MNSAGSAANLLSLPLHERHCLQLMTDRVRRPVPVPRNGYGGSGDGVRPRPGDRERRGEGSCPRVKLKLLFLADQPRPRPASAGMGRPPRIVDAVAKLGVDDVLPNHAAAASTWAMSAAKSPSINVSSSPRWQSLARSGQQTPAFRPTAILNIAFSPAVAGVEGHDCSALRPDRPSQRWCRPPGIQPCRNTSRKPSEQLGRNRRPVLRHPVLRRLMNSTPGAEAG